IERSYQTIMSVHFRENTLNCQDAKSVLRSAKRRDRRPDRVPSQFDKTVKNGIDGSIARSRLPKGQHSVERETIDCLRHTGLPDLTRQGIQTHRIEHDRRRGAQESQVSKLRIEFVVAHRQILLDALLLDQPRNRGFLVTELIDQLEVDGLTAGENPAVGNLFE